MIVCNDDHNTFEHVARTLARYIPATTLERGHELANLIHSSQPSALGIVLLKPPIASKASRRITTVLCGRRSRLINMRQNACWSKRRTPLGNSCPGIDISLEIYWPLIR